MDVNDETGRKETGPSRAGQRRLGRRAFVRMAGLGVGASVLGGLLAACGRTDTPTSGGGATTPAAGQAGTGAGTPRKGGTLVVAFTADPETLDPHATTALRAARVLGLLHDNLVNRDYDGSFKPGLADKWDVSADGKTYTFTLKTGVKFHSGKDFTAEDVKYTFERWLGNDKSPTAYTIRPIDKVEAPDPQTARFTLKEPYNIFLDQVAGSWAVILNKEAVDKAGTDYGVNAVDGTGPFKFVSWTRNQKLAVARHDAYAWGSPMFQNQGAAYVDGVELRIVPEDTTRMAEFQAGNIHLVADVPTAEVERLSKTPGVSIVRYDQLQTTYLGMNTKRAPLDDPKVRQAINYALNREEVVKGASFGLGKPARTMLTPDTPYYWKGADQAAPTFDTNKATALLEEAGWKAGAGGIREKGGQPLVLPLWIINTSETVLQAQIIEQQLAKAGIRVETKQYEESAWFAAARSGEQAAFIIGVFFENADILYFYFYSKQQPAPNRFSYAVPEVDRWLEDSRNNPDKAAIQQDYENVQKRLIEDAPAAPLIHGLGTLGKTDAVEGVKVHPSRWLYRMTDVWLTK